MSDQLFDEWNAACNRVCELERELSAAQARIDELMLEYCPNEMTAEQLSEYARHQVPVSEEEYQSSIQAAAGGLTQTPC